MQDLARYQALDWGTVLARAAIQRTVDQGGWNIWCHWIPGVAALNPAAHNYLRGTGAHGPIGWPSSEKLEACRDAYLDSENPAAQGRAAAAMQVQAFQDVPYAPLGFFFQPIAYRDTLSGILDGVPVFYNIRKA